MKSFLSQTEQHNLRIEHKKERDKRVCDRIKAVLLYDKGWSYAEIAEVLLLTDEAVRQHVQDYKNTHKLKPENGGSQGKLDNLQAEALLKHLQEHVYLYSKDITAYIKATFGIDYSVPGMTDWLKVHGFTYKKPAVVPGKANYEAQEQWIKEYKTLKENLPPSQTICFMDGVHPTHNTKVAFGWILKGERKEIPTNTGRSRINLSGILDIITKKVLVREDITLNTKATIEFLQMIERAYPDLEKVHVFCDNARYYKNKDVASYLANSKIEMHFLPPYSPNLNPIERLWKLLNELILYNKYYEKFSDFRNAVLGFLNSLVEPSALILEVLVKRLTDNFRAIRGPFTQEKINGAF
jgi:transposase